MAEERNTESFGLGLIVAAILFLLLRREFSKGGMRAGAGIATGGSAAAGGSCCCGGGKSAGTQPESVNPGISIGGQSYTPGSFAPSSVRPPVQWIAVGGTQSGNIGTIGG